MQKMNFITQIVFEIPKIYKILQSDCSREFLLTTRESDFSDMWFSQNHKGNYGAL